LEKRRYIYNLSKNISKKFAGKTQKKKFENFWKKKICGQNQKKKVLIEKIKKN